MATFTQAGRVYAGQKTLVIVDGGTAPVERSDTLKLNGRTLTMLEWIRRGVLRTVSTTGYAISYLVQAEPESV